LMLVEDAVKVLEEDEELQVEIVVPALLTAAGLADAIAAASTSRICIVEECPGQFSIGTQAVSELARAGRHTAIQHLGASAFPIPSARTLEQDVLPSRESIIAVALEIVLNSPE